MASAETGFGFLRLLFIEFPFFIGGLPERNQVVVFALGIVPDLENHGVKSAAYPADRAVLLLENRSADRGNRDARRFLARLRIRCHASGLPEASYFSLRQTEIARDWYNSYTITTNASCVNNAHRRRWRLVKQPEPMQPRWRGQTDCWRKAIRTLQRGSTCPRLWITSLPGRCYRETSSRQARLPMQTRRARPAGVSLFCAGHTSAVKDNGSIILSSVTTRTLRRLN